MSDKEKGDPEFSNSEDGFFDFSETNDVAFKLSVLPCDDFVQLFHAILLNPNQGAGIDVSGASGSGKSNFMEWAAEEAIKLGIPVTVIDPHGDSARRIIRNVQALPNRSKKKFVTSS